MKNPVYVFLIFVFFTNKMSLSQSLLIKPHFTLGDSVNYIVTEEEKSSSLFVLLKGKHRFKVKFAIRDTSNGYTINFTTKLLEPINKKFVAESVMDKLRDGIDLTYKLSNSGWVINVDAYIENQLKAILMLDSILTTADLSKKEIGILLLLQSKLQKPDGLQLLLEPILLFNQIFLSPSFRNQKDYHAASTLNIFYEPIMTGTMITELKTINTQLDEAKVSIDFVANKDSAAKVIIPLYQELFEALNRKIPKDYPDTKFETHSQYDIQVSKGYPLYIYKKSVTTFYLKSTSEIEMVRVDE